jgi:hypothetical protein
MNGDRFVRLTTLGDITAARVWAARLESEGIESRLRGEALGPVPVTVGRLAETELWVLESRLEEARRLLVEVEVDHVLGEVETGGTPPATDSTRLLALFLAVLVAGLVARALLWLF